MLGGVEKRRHATSTRGTEQRKALAVAVAVLGLAVPIPAIAGGGSPSRPVADPNSEEIRRQVNRGLQRDKGDETARSDQQSAVSRAQSLSAYRDLTAPQAENLFERTFLDRLSGRQEIKLPTDPEFVTDYLVAGLTGKDAMSPGEAVQRLRERATEADGILPRSPEVNRLIDVVEGRAGGTSTLISSTSPLRGSADGGEEKPIALELEADDGAFQPENALVEMEIPRQLEDGISLGPDGFRVTPVGAEAATPARRPDSRTIFYGGLEGDAADTDFVVVPTEEGLESFAHLRSSAAPERHEYRVDLPDGAEIREAGEGIEVLRNGERLVHVSPPYAEDAEGRVVDANMELSGNDIVVSVSHRNQELEYPILLDPYYRYTWKNSGSTAGLNDWTPYSTGPFTLRQSCAAGLSCYGASPGPGLYVDAPAGQFYSSNAYAGWLYYVPRFAQDQATFGRRPTSYIEGFSWTGQEFHRRGDLNTAPYVINGLYNYQTGWNGYELTYQGDVANRSAGVNAGQAQVAGTKVAVTYLAMNGSPARTLGAYRDSYLGGAEVLMRDPEWPTLRADYDPKKPSGWTDRFDGRIGVQATDPGLGLYDVSLNVAVDLAAPAIRTTVDNACTGAPSSPCPVESSATFDLDSNDLAEGVYFSQVSARDVGNGSTLDPWHLQVDRSNPNVTVSGGLTQPDGAGLDLHFDARDGHDAHPGLPDNSYLPLYYYYWPNELLALRSGVKSVELLVNGERVDHRTQPCQRLVGSCPMVGDINVPASAMQEGANEVKLVVKDQLDHEWVKTWTKNYDPQPDTEGEGITRLLHRFYNASTGRLVDRDFTSTDDYTAGGSAPKLDWMDATQIQTFANARNNGAGVREFKLYLPDRPQPISEYYTCGSGATVECRPKRGTLLTYETRAFPEGYSPGSITAFNGKSQPFGTRNWIFRTDHSNPTIASRTASPRIPILGGGVTLGSTPIEPLPEPVAPETLAMFPGGSTQGLPVLSVPELETELKVRAEDGVLPAAGATLSNAQRRSGIASVELRIDDRPYDRAEQPEVPEECASIGSNCPMEHTFVIDASRLNLDVAHKAKLVVTDHAGRKTSEEFWVIGNDLAAGALDRLAGLLGGEGDRLGLEQYFQYDSQETGGQSSAHVNLDNGNAVWHKMLATNPGRGLSTVVNLTYNSGDRGLTSGIEQNLSNLQSRLGLPNAQALRDRLDSLGLQEISLSQLERIGVLPLSYQEAGHGMSIGVSGLTRLNEPLGGNLINLTPSPSLGGILNPIQINMRDVDGTLHTFKRDLNEPLSWKAPPGVNLHLRQFADIEGILTSAPLGISLPDPSAPPAQQIQQLVESLRDVQLPNGGGAFDVRDLMDDRLIPGVNLRRLWAITRPDGVTYYYNLLGYPTDIEDRNGNVLRYEYEFYQPLTGAPCGVTGGLPLPSVADALELPLPLVCQPRVDRVIDAAGTDELGPNVTVDPDAEARDLEVSYVPGGILDRLGGNNRPGKIRDLVDHAGRKSVFSYDDQGYLVELTENAQPQGDSRTTRLRYGGETSGQTQQPSCPNVETFSAGKGAGIYQELVKGDGPSLYWRLGEDSGTVAADSSGNNRPGSYVAGPTLNSDGALVSAWDDDGAVDLNGTTQHLTSTYSPFVNNQTQTFEGWARRDAESSLDMLFSGTDVTQATPYLTLGGEFGHPKNRVIWAPAGNVAATTAWENAWPGTGTWAHWALVFNEAANTAELFVNGQSKGVKTLNTNYQATAGNLNAGVWKTAGGAHYGFDGVMDEVAVYPKALTADEVDAHYKAGTRSGRPGSDQLSAIQDPNQNWNCIHYDQQSVTGELLGTPVAARAFVDRRQTGKPANSSDRRRVKYTYDGSGPNTATVIDNRGAQWSHTMDDQGRPTQLTNPGGFVTNLEWNSDNQVAKAQRAAGTLYEASTLFSYNQNGLLTTQTEGVGLPVSDMDSLASAGARVTHLEYKDSGGTQRSGLPFTGDHDSDDPDFVSDLVSIQKPKGNTWRFELDSGTGSNVGNVTAEIDPSGAETRMEYGDFGQLVKSQEQYDANAFNTTSFHEFDLSGFPQKVTDPRGSDSMPGDDSTGRWIYGYDTVGNVTQVSDPRGSVDGGPGQQPAEFRTELTYDDYDRLLTERIPKCSTGPACPSRESGDNDARFVDIERTYDANGNLRTQTNRGTSVETEYTYGPTDQPNETRIPNAVTVNGSETQTTRRIYDDEDNLIGVESPEGVKTGAIGDRSTCYVVDAIGRVLAEVRQSGGAFAPRCAPAGESLVTTYTYDPRDNLTAIATPRENKGETLDEAMKNAWNGSARKAMVYNLHDEVTFEYEVKRPNPEIPGDSPQANTHVRSHHYDLNGNEVFNIEHRGFEETDPLVLGPRYADHVTSRVYDQNDRVIATMNGELEATKYVRRADGKVTDVFSPRAPETPATGDFRTHYEYYATGEPRSRSIPHRSGQYGVSDDPLPVSSTSDGAVFGLGEVVYERDPVGNPKVIWDARHPYQANYEPDEEEEDPRIVNTFYDTGELRSTTRPSWWQLDWSGGMSKPDAGIKFGATGSNGAKVDLAAPIGGPTLAERTGSARGSADGGGAGSSAPASPNDFGQVRPEELPDMLPMAGKISFSYDDEMRLAGVQDVAESKYTIDYDGPGRIIKKTWPFQPGFDIAHQYRWDLNDNLKQFSDGEQQSWNYTYDQFDRMIEEDAPGAHSQPTTPSTPFAGNSPREITRFGYDPNGNLVTRETPRGTRTSEQGDYTFRFIYDGVDRLTIERNPTGDEWRYGYDGADNRVSEISPRGFETKTRYDAVGRPTVITDPDNQQTRIRYDDAGNQVEIREPGSYAGPESDKHEARVTRQTFDGRDLLWKQNVEGRISGSGGEVNRGSRLTVTEYDPNGNLRRTINPAGASDAYTEDGGSDEVAAATSYAKNATVNVYNNDDLLRRVHLPWADEDGDPTTPPDPVTGEQAPKKYFQGFARDDLGRVSKIRSAHQSAAAKVPTACYTHHLNGWIKSTADQGNEGLETECAKLSDGQLENRIDYTYDRQGNQTAWKFDGSGGDRGRTVRRTFYPNGLLRSRLAYEGNESSPEKTREYRYFYNANGSLAEMTDADLNRTTLIQRDPAEREHVVDETWTGGLDTMSRYDPSGNVTERWTDGHWQNGTMPGAKTTTFRYDKLDRETQTRVNPAGDDSSLPDRITRTGYYPSGQVQRRLEWNDAADAPNMDDPQADQEAGYTVKESNFFDPDGRINRTRRYSEDGDRTKDQAYFYDRNANRTRDERGTHSYNARDQLTRWTRGPESKHPGSTVDYLIGGTGETRAEVESSGVGPGEAGRTTYNYDTQGTYKLQSVTSPGPQGSTVTSTYSYDPFNNVSQIHAQSSAQGSTPSTLTYTYDKFGRRIKSSGTGVANVGTYCYDGLDRRDARFSEASASCTGTSTTKREYSYVGTSEKLSREKRASGANETYDYTSAGERLGQEKHGSSATTGNYRSFATDAQGSVEGLENADGEMPESSQYDYDPFGDLECKGEGGDCEEQLGGGQGGSDNGALKENPFRYQGFYYDAGIKTYDMQARDYRPDVGRFTSEDRYEQAGADLELQSDPLTQNRYAFAGGNPVTNVEFDGHFPGYNDQPTEDGTETQGHDWCARTNCTPGLGQSEPSPEASRRSMASTGTAQMARDVLGPDAPLLSPNDLNPQITSDLSDEEMVDRATVLAGGEVPGLTESLRDRRENKRRGNTVYGSRKEAVDEAVDEARTARQEVLGIYDPSPQDLDASMSLLGFLESYRVRSNESDVKTFLDTQLNLRPKTEGRVSGTWGGGGSVLSVELSAFGFGLKTEFGNGDLALGVQGGVAPSPEFGGSVLVTPGGEVGEQGSTSGSAGLCNFACGLANTSESGTYSYGAGFNVGGQANGIWYPFSTRD